MIPDDPELRHALAARSAEPGPEFRARMHAVLSAGRPTTNWMPAVAIVTVFVVSFASVGILLAARNLTHSPVRGLVSPPRTASPSALPSESPVELPSQTALSAPSREVLWAFVDYRLLFRSRDSGQTWERRQLPPTIEGDDAQLRFAFADADNGWALLPGVPATQCQAAKGYVWHTSDGAATWHQLQPSGIDEAQCKQFLSFVDKTDGFLTAWDDNSPPTIYRTTDGGMKWRSSRLPDPPGFKTNGGGFTLRAQEVVRRGNVLLVNAYGMQEGGGKGYVFRSVDGGATWTYASEVPNAAIAVAFVTESRWLQVIVPGQSVETSDAGKTWHRFASDYAQAAPVSPQVVFGDALVGYATVRGSIQRTEDGGLHWSPIKTPGT